LKAIRPPENVDIVHSNSWNAFAFKRHGIPLVVTEHLSVLSESYKKYKSPLQYLYHTTVIRLYEYLSLSRADAITAVSHFTSKELPYNPRHLPIHTIHNWVNTSNFVPAAITARESDRPYKLLFVGNFSLRKGADLLAPIMERLGPDYLLDVAGGRQKNISVNLPNNISFLGKLSESSLIERYQGCDALLFPSRLEGFGLAVLEAMACGKPVICANSSALPEVVEDGVSGILCQTDDIDAFVKACQRLRQNPELAEQMGKAARKRAVEHFTEEVIIPKYVDLYRELMS
jgi:glycosyltransferase involved in cell wall biosynthesis